MDVTASYLSNLFLNLDPMTSYFFILPMEVIPKVYLVEILFKFMLVKEIDDKLWMTISPLLPVWKHGIGNPRSICEKRLTDFACSLH